MAELYIGMSNDSIEALESFNLQFNEIHPAGMFDTVECYISTGIICPVCGEQSHEELRGEPTSDGWEYQCPECKRFFELTENNQFQLVPE